jgi:hypothetical protein
MPDAATAAQPLPDPPPRYPAAIHRAIGGASGLTNGPLRDQDQSRAASPPPIPDWFSEPVLTQERDGPPSETRIVRKSGPMTGPQQASPTDRSDADDVEQHACNDTLSYLSLGDSFGRTGPIEAVLSHCACRILTASRSCWLILIASRAERRRLPRTWGLISFSWSGSRCTCHGHFRQVRETGGGDGSGSGRCRVG